jgi:TolB protein
MSATAFSRRLLVVAGLVAFAGPAWAQGRAVLEIRGANFKPMPIALVTDGAPEGFRRALDSDLRGSGVFALLDPRSFLPNTQEGVTRETINFNNWSSVGADALVKVAVAGDEKSGWRLEGHLFEVAARREALKLAFDGRAGELTGFAHDFANLIYRHFTGEKGIFRTRIAYVRRLAAGKEVFVSDFDGGNPVAMTTGGLNLLPGWSPDGKKIGFTSYRTGSPMLHLLDATSKAVRALAPRGDLQTGAAFSPDGKRIAFTMSDNGASDVWLVDVDGRNLRNLTGDVRDIDSSPSWSPDGKRIAFVSKRSGDPQIFVMNVDGDPRVERMTFQGSYNQTPDWSPRGDVIAFTARDERNRFDLFTVDVATKQIKRLTQDQGHNEEPSYSPNGRHIAFVSTRDGGRRRLYVMNADGTNPRPLRANGVPIENVSTPAWGPWTDE